MWSVVECGMLLDVMYCGTAKLHALSRLILLMLLSYHRRLRMIAEALELRVESERVCHCWCMCVVGHGDDGLGDGRDGGGG